MVFVSVRAGGTAGIGYTYADASAGKLIESMLADLLVGSDPMQTAQRYTDLYAAIRNNGRGGITSMAISALDIALWDLKGKILNAPVSALLGAARASVPVYGSGGFTSYSARELRDQLARWVHDEGIPRVKMKVGRDPGADAARVSEARKAIGADAELFVDANGAYTPEQAIGFAAQFAQCGVRWFEEPVYHNDFDGNRFVRERVPAGMEVSNGEYGYAPYDFLQIIRSGAADVVQADVTRCGGYSGFLAVDGLCQAHNVPLSTHCAPYVTLSAAGASKQLRHMEYFADHVRIERLFFDGPAAPRDGSLAPDPERPGIGLELKTADAEGYAL